MAAVLTLLVVMAANNASLVGRWQQAFDTARAATGYIAEFREDGTWTVSAEGESIKGTYELIDDVHIRITYPDGTASTAKYHISADRFGLISADSGRQQVFLRVQ
jgi:putative alpha-1,2-mannosidase